MERRGTNTWIVAVLAIAVGFLVALLIFGGDDNNNTSATVDATGTSTATTAATTAATTTADGATTTATTATTPTASAPGSPQATVPGCIDLWNQSNNSTNKAFLVGLIAKQPVRVHVGITGDVPPECQVTIVANNGDAYVFPEGGGTTYPYAQAPGTTTAASLPAEQKTSNALEQSDGAIKSR